MQLQDFNTLEEAQAYELVEDKKQVGSGQARGFFVTTGIWAALKSIQSNPSHPLFSLADAILITASDASSYFGLDETTAEGMANIGGAQVLVDAEIMTPDQRNEFLNKRYTKIKPFASATQEQLDKAKIVGSTTATSVSYGGGNHLVTAGKSVIDVDILFDNPVPFDCTISLKVNQKAKNQEVFVDSGSVISQVVKAGSTNVGLVLHRRYMRHIQIEAVVDLKDTSFIVEVSAV